MSFMQYDLMIKNGKEEKIIDYLKKFDFVTVKKKKAVKKKKLKMPTFSYFGLMPDWDFDVSEMRKNGYRKTKLGW